MKSKTRCTKTIVFNKKDLINKLGLKGKILSIALHTKHITPFDVIGSDDGIEVTLLISEEKS